MSFQNNLSSFLQHGYFLCSPMFGKVWCLIGENSTLKPKNEPIKNAFYRNSFYGALQNPWITGSFYELSINQFFKLILQGVADKPLVRWKPQDIKKYEEFFYEAQKTICEGTLDKAVPFAQAIGEAQLDNSHLLYFFAQLEKLKNNKTIFMYGFWNFSEGYLNIGASPELLFVKLYNKVETIALAGTSVNPQLEFKNKKMKDEHGYVLKDLSNELSLYGDVRIGKTRSVKFNKYFHKKTKISVICDKSQPSFVKLLKSLYPSAAIGAYPREKGLDFLSKIEKKLHINRGFFASSFGIQTQDNFMLCIGAIRGIEWSQGSLSITAGGGIVSRSQLSSEWKEILLKLESIKAIFGLV